MFEGLTGDDKTTAMQNAIPQKPRRYELGGGYYYTCHWLKCGNTVNRWQNYCDKCGQKGYTDIPLVFVDAGLEYPEIRDFVRGGGGVIRLFG